MQNRKSKPPVFIRFSVVRAEPKVPLRVVPAESDADTCAVALAVPHSLADPEHMAKGACSTGRATARASASSETWRRADAEIVVVVAVVVNKSE